MFVHVVGIIVAEECDPLPVAFQLKRFICELNEALFQIKTFVTLGLGANTWVCQLYLNILLVHMYFTIHFADV